MQNLPYRKRNCHFRKLVVMVKFVDQYKTMSLRQQASRLLLLWVSFACLKNLPIEKFYTDANQYKNTKMLPLSTLVLNSSD